MTERAIEIRERIRDDRVDYRDSILTLRESHIVMNALQALEAYEKENAELRARLEKAVELPCKLGDTVYQTDTNGTRIFKSTVKGIIFDTGGMAFDERAIGERIFLTEEAVKEKMKKLQEKYND